MIYKHGKNKKGLETTTAILFNTADYAKGIVAKRLGISKIESDVSGANNAYGAKDMLENIMAWSSLTMHHKYTGTVTCDERDTFDVVKGEALAREKALKNMKQAAHSRIIEWQSKILRKLLDVSERGFYVALDTVLKKSDKKVLYYSDNIASVTVLGLVNKMAQENPEALKKALEDLNLN